MVNLPPGTGERIAAAADAEGMTIGGFLRREVMRGIERSERRRAREQTEAQREREREQVAAYHRDRGLPFAPVSA